MPSGCTSARCRPYSAVRRPVRNPLAFDSSVRANSRKGTILATEAVNDGRIGSCHAITGGSLRRSDMKALTTAPQRVRPGFGRPGKLTGAAVAACSVLHGKSGVNVRRLEVRVHLEDLRLARTIVSESPYRRHRNPRTFDDWLAAQGSPPPLDLTRPALAKLSDLPGQAVCDLAYGDDVAGKHLLGSAPRADRIRFGEIEAIT